MASILDSLRRRAVSYGNRGVLKLFQMPKEYGGSIPGAVLNGAAQANPGGVSKAVSRAGEWISSVLSARGQGKALSENPAAKNLKAAPAAAAAGTTVLNGGPVSQLLQAGNWSESVSVGMQNMVASNIALQSVNARYPAVSGSTGSGTAMLGALATPAGGGTAMMQAANQGSVLQAASIGVAAAMDAVSGDGSVYRDFAAASSGAAGENNLVQVEMVNNNSVSSELDLDRVVSYLTDKVAEGLQTAAEAVHW